jgi:nucleoid-associated protein YgaU
MTSDAKVGLLLGLVFIFIIAFIINGLPRFRSDTSNSELTTNYARQQDDSPGIADREHKAQEVFNYARQVRRKAVDEVQSSIDQVKPAAAVPTTDDKTQAKEPESVKPALPRTYVVTEGDNLAVIAQKFYGADEGNRKINVMRIFRANCELLGSPDEIYVGQKLTIPPLPSSTADKDKTESVFSGTVFRKVESIGKRLLSADRPEAGRAKQSRQYIVREGDSLWQIAAEQLGDGSRYKEINKLNGDILENEDTIAVGMRLRMPPR